jgi:LPXTG-site transpeptidase (sortase) family protein
MPQRRSRRTVQVDTSLYQQGANPLTVIGLTMIGVASVGLVLLVVMARPTESIPADGPPPHLIAAATMAMTPSPPVLFPQAPQQPPPGWATPTLNDIPEEWITPTAGTAADYTISDSEEVLYWLSIPAIALEAPVVARTPTQNGMATSLPVPRAFAAAWDATSAEPGFPGNTVLTGHHNVYGRVFGRLTDLNYGDEIALWSPLGVFSYYVTDIVILEERGQPFSVRLEHTSWIQPTEDVRVTLVTCWPMATNSHRLIVVAHMQ